MNTSKDDMNKLQQEIKETVTLLNEIKPMLEDYQKLKYLMFYSAMIVSTLIIITILKIV